MDFWNSDVFRIILATSAAFMVGSLYYNPTLNPTMETWMNITYPGISDPGAVMDPTMALIGTVISQLGIATIMNRYMNTRHLTTSRLIVVAVELWILVVLFAFPKTLWSNGSLVKFAIDHTYDLLVALTLSMTLGYRRFPGAASV